jgi:hypothetical protein
MTEKKYRSKTGAIWIVVTIIVALITVGVIYRAHHHRDIAAQTAEAKPTSV